MRNVLTALALFTSTAAFAAPEFPVDLVGDYCGLGPCLEVTATLFEDGTCSVDLVGGCSWRYSKRLRMIEVTFDDGTMWIAERDGMCFTGPLEIPLGPPEDIEMCVAM